MQQAEIIIGELQPIIKLQRDVLKALRSEGGVGGVTDSEARYLVDLYYLMQKMRVRTNNQIKGLERDADKSDKKAEPHEIIDWVLVQARTLEDQVKKILAIYTEMHSMSWFFEQTLGIGPVLSAGLLAHIDIHRAPTVGHIWNFAGLNPDIEWSKGQKRPFNSQLKTLCWKIGDSFVKVSGRDDAFYGKIYRQRKASEVDKNDRGDFADQAAEKLKRYNIGKSTDAYKAYSSGKLPPAHLDMRARRYTVKLFLSHLHQRWHEQEIGPVPRPWVIEHGGHAHFIAPPQVPPETSRSDI